MTSGLARTAADLVKKERHREQWASLTVPLGGESLLLRL
jgi:hypothetical protein